MRVDNYPDKRDHRLGRERIKQFISEYPYNAETIVDLGAYSGRDLINAAEIHRQARLYALDYNTHFFDDLMRKGIHPIKFDVEKDEIPFGGGEVDIIIANQLVEHCKDLYWMLSECARVLKINGRLIIGIPNLTVIQNRFLFMFGKQPRCLNNTLHLRGFTEEAFIEFVMISKCFRLVGVRGSCPFVEYGPIGRWVADKMHIFSPGLYFCFVKVDNYFDDYLTYIQNSTSETLYRRTR